MLEQLRTPHSGLQFCYKEGHWDQSGKEAHGGGGCPPDGALSREPGRADPRGCCPAPSPRQGRGSPQPGTTPQPMPFHPWRPGGLTDTAGLSGDPHPSCPELRGSWRTRTSSHVGKSQDLTCPGFGETWGPSPEMGRVCRKGRMAPLLPPQLREFGDRSPPQLGRDGPLGTALAPLAAEACVWHRRSGKEGYGQRGQGPGWVSRAPAPGPLGAFNATALCQARKPRHPLPALRPPQGPSARPGVGGSPGSAGAEKGGASPRGPSYSPV